MHLTALGIAAAKALVPATESEDEAGAGAAAEAGERQGVLTLTESRAFAGRVDERPLHSCWVVLRRGVLLYAPVTPTLTLTLTLTPTLTLTLTRGTLPRCATARSSPRAPPPSDGRRTAPCRAPPAGRTWVHAWGLARARLCCRALRSGDHDQNSQPPSFFKYRILVL